MKTEFKIELIKAENRQDRRWGWAWIVHLMSSQPSGSKIFLRPMAIYIVKESKIYGLSCSCQTFIYNKNNNRRCEHTEAVVDYVHKNKLINTPQFELLKDRLLIREI